MSLVKRFGIKPDHRISSIGRTGSGKTVLNHYLLREMSNVIVLDTKGTLNWREFTLITDPRELSRLNKFGRKPPNIIFRPPWKWPREQFDNFFEWILRRGNTRLYVDEIYSVANERTSPSDPLGAIATRGRELGVALFAAAQRPARVPMFLLSEADHVFTFFLGQKSDIIRVNDIVEEEINVNTLDFDNHEFRHIQVPKKIVSKPLILKL